VGGGWELGTGFWVLGTWNWELGTGYWVLDTGYLSPASHHFHPPIFSIPIFLAVAFEVESYVAGRRGSRYRMERDGMKTHQEIDRRSLLLSRAVVEKLERGDVLAGVEKARRINRAWRAQHATPLHEEWAAMLARPWPEIRAALLDESPEGARLRQNSPFCGILTPRERWALYKEYTRHAA